MKRVENKVVIVTGGASGIGAASVKLMAIEGAKVLFCDVQEEAGKALEAELMAQGYAVKFVALDVRTSEANQKLVQLAVESFGGVNAIVCCAGRLVSKLLVDFEENEWADSLAVHCDAPYYLYKHAVPEMIKAGGGSVVFMGDGCMDMPIPKLGSNLASSMALYYLTRQIGVEHARENIRANVISTTLVEDTGYWQSNPGMLEVLKCCSNGHHTFLAEDVAPIILFMVSDESKMVTASNLKANDNYDCGFVYDQWAALRK